MKRDEIIDLLKRHRVDLDRLGVKDIAVFGSIARDEAGPASDIDILVDFQGRADFDRYMDLKFFLEGLFRRRVDLVTRAALKARMRPIVEREAIRVA
jgi:hypothetical protein